jgi:hypothetical protein
MNHLIEQMIADGLTLSISEDGNLDVIGDQEVINRWIGTIKENKAAILAELKQPVTLQEASRNVHETLRSRYIVTVRDATTDPVLVQVTINGLASFDLAIPLAKYDPFAIMDAMDHHSPMAALARNVAIPVPAHENVRTVGLPDEHEREAA